LYFAAMICVVIVSAVKKRLNSPIHAAVIIAAVFANICVWLLEQLVNINFEFLSVSYIISELFLLGIYMIIRETEKMLVAENSHAGSPDNGHNEIQEPSDEQCGKAGLHEQCVALLNNLPLLTPTERLIYDMYIDGKSTKEVLENLGIKENTLKFHNKNIYSKLGVSSRKQLIGIARLINDEKPE